MSEIQGVGAVRRGFVRGVVSQRHGGVAFPADLLRVACRMARRDGERRRVASFCAGYLVTEREPAFSPRRWGYIPRNDVMCMADAVSLDAPDVLPLGACVNLLPLWWQGDDAPQLVIKRGGA